MSHDQAPRDGFFPRPAAEIDPMHVDCLTGVQWMRFLGPLPSEAVFSFALYPDPGVLMVRFAAGVGLFAARKMEVRMMREAAISGANWKWPSYWHDRGILFLPADGSPVVRGLWRRGES